MNLPPRFSQLPLIASAAMLTACSSPPPGPATVVPTAPPAVVTQPTAMPATTAAQVITNQYLYTGRIPCEQGQHVDIQPDPHNPGQFTVSGKGFKYHMRLVPTNTGVIRLEDHKAGAVWLQIANKSMLMNQKAGRRMADECMSPQQMQVAQAIRQAPPPSLLETGQPPSLPAPAKR